MAQQGSFGNFSGYTPLPNGGTAFQTTDGKQMTFFGPQAEQLKARLDATAPPMLAAAPTAPSPNRTDAGGSLADRVKRINASANEQYAQSPAGKAEAAVNEFAATGGQSPKPDAPAPAGSTASTDSEWDPFMVNEKGEQILLRRGGDPNNPLDLLVNEKARAGSKGGLVERSRTVKGGYEVDEDYLKRQEELKNAEVAGAFQAAQAGQQLAQEQAAFIQAQQEELAKAQQEEADRAKAIDAKVAELEAKHQAAEEAFLNSPNTPGNVGYKTGAGWANAIAMAMGAFAASLNKGPNLVAPIVERNIDLEMRRLEAERNVRGKRAQNALTDLEKELGNKNLAVSSLKAMKLKQAENQFQLMALRAKSQEEAAKYTQAAVGINKKYEEEKLKYLQDAQGEVTRSMQMTPGSAGSKGGLRRLTAKEAGGAQIKDGSGKATAVPTERTAKFSSSSKAIEQAEDVLGLLGNEKAGETFDPTGVTSWGEKAKDNKLDEASNSLAATYQKSSDLGSTEDDAKKAREIVLGNGSVNARRRGAERAADEAAKNIAIEIRGLPPDQQAAALESLPPRSRARVIDALKQ